MNKINPASKKTIEDVNFVFEFLTGSVQDRAKYIIEQGEEYCKEWIKNISKKHNIIFC